MADRYSDFFINRKQTQQIAFAIIADIEAYCDAHPKEFTEFLKTEEEKERRKNNAEKRSGN